MKYDSNLTETRRRLNEADDMLPNAIKSQLIYNQFLLNSYKRDCYTVLRVAFWTLLTIVLGYGLIWVVFAGFAG